MGTAGAIELAPGRWFGWQMLPGYGPSDPYFSPIYLHSVTLVPGDPNLQSLEFDDCLYAAGVQNFEVAVRPVLWAASFVICHLVEAEPVPGVRAAVISTITHEWLARCCPELLRQKPLRSPATGAQPTVEAYLATNFGLS